MGRAASRQKINTEEKVTAVNELQTDKQDQNDDESKRQVKILLLGTGQSGKSTIMKQMEILAKNGFSEEVRKNYEDVVYVNAVQSMLAIIRAMKDLGITFGNPDRVQDGETIEKAERNEKYDLHYHTDVAYSLKTLWADSGVKECYERSREYQLGDNAKYYFNALDRLCDPSYIPTDQDLLHSRVKTTGMIEINFEYKDLSFSLIDVGGARCERKKWVHVFENVTAIIFCVAMSEYDQVLNEDEDMNRMRESLKLFQSISSLPLFSRTPVMLFLNKKDLFKEKITKSPLSICFENYIGENEYEPASEFIREQFEKEIDFPKIETIYTHFVNATDTSDMRNVFDTVFDVILKQTWEQISFLILLILILHE